MARSDPLRILLLGKTGGGKSATGNTILGEKKFNASASASSTTKTPQKETCTSEDGRRIEVVDAPGLFDTDESHRDTAVKLAKAIKMLTSPGPHAVLYPLRIGRVTEEELKSFGRIKTYFGEEITKQMIVVFTGRDDLEEDGQSINNFVQNAPEGLKKILDECGRRYVALNNRARNDRDQVAQLLDKIDAISNDDRHFDFSVEGEVSKEMENRTKEAEKKEVESTDYGKQQNSKITKLKIAVAATSAAAVCMGAYAVFGGSACAAGAKDISTKAAAKKVKEKVCETTMQHAPRLLELAGVLPDLSVLQLPKILPQGSKILANAGIAAAMAGVLAQTSQHLGPK